MYVNIGLICVGTLRFAYPTLPYACYKQAGIPSRQYK